ncbi:FAD-dependent oxidoreductase [Cyclobacterium plantarum]|uniref:FAD-dependent oxidoreductase n=1 Tax=Cyclobacterium plantarum TaxID=2716263 RepID=UPI003F713780
MENCSHQINPTHTVLIGTGSSVADYLLYLEKQPLVGRITIIGQDWTDLFFLQCLCSLTKLKLKIDQIDPGECADQKGVFFVFSKVESIDFNAKKIFCQKGVLQYDSLILVNENRPKALLNHKLKHIKKYHSSCEFSSWIKDVNNVAVIEGNDFPALAMAERLSDFGIKTYLVCRSSYLAEGFLPDEEACLLAKHLKNNGITVLFDQQVEKYLLDQSGNISGFRLTEGKEYVCTMALHASGHFPEFSYLRDTDFYSGRTFFVDKSCRVTSLKDVYVIGHNLSIEKKVGGDLSKRSFYPDLGAISFFKDKLDVRKRQTNFIHYELMGLTWSIYGDFSTNWGKSSQNFYWEHPNGQISFRLLFDARNFTVISIVTLGIGFKDQFMINAIDQQWKAEELMDKLDRGIYPDQSSSEIFTLIFKAFTVEFKEKKKENNSSFMNRILEKLF